MKREILKLQSVGKNYPTYRSELQRFARWFGVPFKAATDFWAIRDINLSVTEGETVALIGQNGAGKSTLLKLITGTIQPTTGQIAVGGRISAILELGLGFNAEFTGRQNVMHSGGLLGHTDVELRGMMDWIEAFAEIGEHFDLPVRTYSSGMMARLAFALATAHRPELLIVDEVLSVGDSYFQHKSFNRIREFRDQGSTILFVTHGMSSVRELCDRVVLLHKGRVLKDGLPDEVVDYYNAMIAEKENAKLSIEQRRRRDGWLHTEFGNGQARMDAFELYSLNSNAPVTLARVGEPLEIRSRIRILEDIEELVVGHRLTDRQGHVVWGSNTFHTRQVLAGLRAGTVVESALAFPCALGPGSYGISFGLHTKDSHLIDCYHKSENQLVFDVMNTDHDFFIGTTHLPAEFRLRVESDS